jgi:hypothetical protein
MRKNILFNILSHPNGEAAYDAVVESVRQREVHTAAAQAEGSSLKDKKLNAFEKYFCSLNLFPFDALDSNLFWSFEKDGTVVVYQSRMNQDARDSEHILKLADHPKLDQIRKEYDSMLDACRERAIKYSVEVLNPVHTRAWEAVYAILEDVGAIGKGERPEMEIEGRMVSRSREEEEEEGGFRDFMKDLLTSK